MKFSEFQKAEKSSRAKVFEFLDSMKIKEVRKVPLESNLGEDATEAEKDEIIAKDEAAFRVRMSQFQSQNPDEKEFSCRKKGEFHYVARLK